MGDSYVKSEFRLTRGTDNPLHIIAFLSQWKIYLDELESSLQAQLGQVARKGKGKATEMTWSGRKLNVEAFEKMSGEQVGQLYELMHATKDVWKSWVSSLFQLDRLHADPVGQTSWRQKLRLQRTTRLGARWIRGNVMVKAEEHTLRHHRNTYGSNCRLFNRPMPFAPQALG
jgi:hypothetical protein